jgi:TrmH family RNA methyltransferase
MIDSIKNEKIKYLKKLRTSKYINEEGKFLIEGFHLVNEAINSDVVIELFILENTDIDFNGKVTVISESVMRYLSTLESITPVVALCKKFDYEAKPYNKVVILDNIQDPGNAGTIIRNAVAFNADAVIFSENSVNIYNDKLIRATQGMFFKIKLIESSLVDYIKMLKQNNIKVYGTSLKNAKELSDCEKSENYGIIFGNEGKGISEDILNICDELIKIEMNEACESLNVGVSSGIILYYFGGKN